MEYYVKGRYSLKTIKENIFKDKFKELKHAKETIDSFQKFITDYQLVVESFRNLEEAKFKAEIGHVLNSKLSYKDFFKMRVFLGTPTISYLSSSRYFLDSLNKITKDTLSEELYRSYSDLRSKIYEDSIGYRFIEALRNYSQHTDLPFHTTTYHNFLEDKNNPKSTNHVTAISLYAIKEKLLKDKKFKKEVLNDHPEKIDIILNIRYHLEGLYKQFDFLKDRFLAVGETSREILDNITSEMQTKTEKKIFKLDAFAAESDDTTIERVPIVTNWYEATKESMKELGNLTNLHKRYVTGKIIEKNKP